MTNDPWSIKTILGRGRLAALAAAAASSVVLAGCTPGAINPEDREVTRARHEAQARLERTLDAVAAPGVLGTVAPATALHDRCTKGGGTVLMGGHDWQFAHLCSLRLTRYAAGQDAGALGSLDQALRQQGFGPRGSASTLASLASQSQGWDARGCPPIATYEREDVVVEVQVASARSGGEACLHHSAETMVFGSTTVLHDRWEKHAASWAELGNPAVAFAISAETVYAKN